MEKIPQTPQAAPTTSQTSKIKTPDDSTIQKGETPTFRRTSNTKLQNKSALFKAVQRSILERSAEQLPSPPTPLHNL